MRDYTGEANYNVRTVTAAATAAVLDYMLADTTTAGFAVTAPSVSTSGTRWGMLWKAGTTAPTISGSSFAGGTPTFTMVDQAFEFLSDGTNWYQATASSILINENTQTASYTLVLTDNGGVVEMNVATANTLTVPPNSSVAFPVGSTVEVFQLGAGQTTITPGTGVTILSAGSKTKIASQYTTVGLRQRAANTWVLVGNLA